MTAQPVGAYASFLRYKKNQGVTVGNNSLIVDVGFFTIDWVVVTGNQISDKRSGFTKGRMSVVMRAIMKALRAEHKITINAGLAQQIEEALGTDNLTISIFGEKVDFTKYIEDARAEVAEHINVVVDTVGSSQDISDIVLRGGGAKFFTPLFKKRYPKNIITCRTDSPFEVVNGLYAMRLVAAAKAVEHTKLKGVV